MGAVQAFQGSYSDVMIFDRSMDRRVVVWGTDRGRDGSVYDKKAMLPQPMRALILDPKASVLSCADS